LVDLETINAGLYHPSFPKGWKRSQLYELANWTNGIAFKDINFDEYGLPVIKISEIKNGLTDQTKYTKQYFDESVLIRTGDLLFSWSGQPETSIDASWWRGTQGWLNQHIFRVTVKDGIDESFFYYILKYLKPNFIGIARNKQTTGLGHVTKKDLARIEVAYPPLPEQRRIAHILGTLDDKIENNRKTAKTLEAMAQAIFKSWFVDFDPVRAKMAGESRESICKRLKITPEILDLFPDRLVDSELGEIPEGWGVGTFGDYVDIVGGSTPSTNNSAYWLSGIHSWATPKDLSGLTMPVLLATENKITDAGLHQVSSRLLPVGTVLLSSRAPIGYLAITEIPVAINQGFIALKPHNHEYCIFLLLLIKHNMEEIISRANGSTFLEISKAKFRPIPVVSPAQGILQSFAKLAMPLFLRIVSLEKITRLLAVQRDTLLSPLISGEIRIPDLNSITDGPISELLSDDISKGSS
jgi:type I restriction enzyme S subunit